jgi:hypothetical protein
MERRRLLAVGGVLSVTAFATTVGLGATFGLFGLTQPESPVGRLGGPAPAAAQVASHRAVANGTTGAAATGGAALDDGADD